MQYLLLIYGNEADWAGRPDAMNAKEHAAYMEFTQQIAASGNLRAATRCSRRRRRRPCASATARR